MKRFRTVFELLEDKSRWTANWYMMKVNGEHSCPGYDDFTFENAASCCVIGAACLVYNLEEIDARDQLNDVLWKQFPEEDGTDVARFNNDIATHDQILVLAKAFDEYMAAAVQTV